VSYGQYTRGVELSFVEPYLLGYRLAGGIDLFAKQTQPTSYVSYGTTTIGTNLRLGLALTEELSIQPHYSIYRQEVTLPSAYNDCILSPNALINGGGGVNAAIEASSNWNGLGGCYANGEAALPVRIELSNGPVMVSTVGYTLAYNTVDNNKAPTSGLYAEIRQDFAGAGGDVNFIRNSFDVRNYYEVFSDIIGVLHLQGGEISGWGNKNLRMLDNFQMGPNLVRGFAPGGIGPRDESPGSITNDALGGTMYWGASFETQTPLYFLPKEIGIKIATFADAGSLWGYKSETYWPVTGEQLTVADSNSIRSSVGAGLIWDSPLGPLRFDLAYALTKQSYDHTQIFRFSGGTKF
jgi:outer membrane protein insertion porin family